jgi:hypothetical protein
MNITPQPLTAGNAPTFELWAAKIAALIQDSISPRINRMLMDEIESNPDFATAINALSAGDDKAQEAIALWAKSDTVKAARIHRMVSEIPMTIGALRLALECIKATAKDAEAIEYDSITYEEARDYCALILDTIR